MPKGKKCEVCKEGRMRRNYTRSYWKGYKFTEEHPEGIDNHPKGEFNPIGWLCDMCGIFIPDDTNYLMYMKWNKRKEHHEQLKRDLRESEWELAEYKYENRKKYYTLKDVNRYEKIAEKMMLRRFWRIRGIIETYGFLKGMKEMRAYRFTEQDMKDQELTDDQILKKAKLIETRRKLGY